jgi:hypothetical protein
MDKVIKPKRIRRTPMKGKAIINGKTFIAIPHGVKIIHPCGTVQLKMDSWI